MTRSLTVCKFLQPMRAFRVVALVASALVAPAIALAQFGMSDDDVNILQQRNSVSTNAAPAPTSQGEAPAVHASGPLTLGKDANATLNPRTPVAAGETPIALPPYVPSEFEKYVNMQLERPSTQPVRRFGSTLLTDAIAAGGQDTVAGVPGNYIIKPGDEIALTLWGSVDANLRLTVDRSGVISVPRVGAINVGGVRNADLKAMVTRRVAQTFTNFELSVSVGQVRPIRVFVSGYAQRPGSITVSGLSSVLHAVLRAGGPSAAGSFRDIRLSRDGQLIARYDLYDLLLNDDRGADQLVQADDIVFIGPIGPQVGVVGSVNQEAIFELKPGETLGDALRMAGGFAPVADRSRVTLERLGDRTTGHVTQLDLPQHQGDALATGDLISAYSVVTAALPSQHQNVRVHIDGEVVKPGDYVLAPGSSLSDAVRTAGGLTSAAYPFGAEFTRVSVRATQQANFDRAIRELETNLAKEEATKHVAIGETDTRVASDQANTRLIASMRELRPTGRVVLEVTPNDASIPDLVLEDGDTLRVPKRGTSVGVFGSVFNSGSFVYRQDRAPKDYLHLAGGPTRGADKKSMFVIHANGAVVSAQQGASFWHSGNEFNDEPILPGDTIFVPEEMDKSTFIQDAKDWTQIFFQFGLGVAGIKTLGL